MKICHIIIGLNVGGAELMLARLIKDCQSHHPTQSHTVISLTTIGKVGQKLQASGIDVYELKLTSIKNLFWVCIKLFKLIRRTRPDIIQTWMYHADLLGGIVGRLAGCNNIIWGIRTTDVGSGLSKVTVCLAKACAYLSYYIPRAIICAADAARTSHVALGYDDSKMQRWQKEGAFHCMRASVRNHISETR